MILLYSFLKKAIPVFVFGIFCSLVTSAQCGPIVQDFDTPNSMAGFSSSTQGNSDPGFTWGTNGIFTYLERCSIPNPATFIITSPTYQTAVSQTSIGVGFDLDGVVNASQVTIFIEYSSGGNIVSHQIAQLAPIYAANHATVCVSAAINTIPGYVAGMSYRVRILIDAPAATNNNQCIQFDKFRTTGTDSQIGLPVSFTGITARKAGTGVEISWTVAGEKEVSHYVVEKSSDALNYTIIGEVKANGNSSYSFTDRNGGNGLVYYRIRNIDLDGRSSYSNVVKLNLERSIRLNTWPQPVRTEVTVEHGLSLNGKIIIASAAGQVLKTVQVKQGETRTTINVAALHSGLYIIRLEEGEGQVSTVKMIKQ